MTEPMKLTADERTKLEKTKSQSDFYKICDQLKERRNGQYPAYLSREVLQIFQNNFPPEVE